MSSGSAVNAGCRKSSLQRIVLVIDASRPLKQDDDNRWNAEVGAGCQEGSGLVTVVVAWLFIRQLSAILRSSRLLLSISARSDPAMPASRGNGYRVGRNLRSPVLPFKRMDLKDNT
jgi:hypothetical protein